MALHVDLSYDEVMPYAVPFIAYQDAARTQPVDWTGKTINWFVFEQSTPDVHVLTFTKSGDTTGDFSPAFTETDIAGLASATHYRYRAEIWAGAAPLERLMLGRFTPDRLAVTP